jgi:diaminopimelate decarboxylase
MGASVLSDAFAQVGGTLHCEGVPLDAIARDAGTPSYVYSARGIRDQYLRLRDAIEGVPSRIHYSMKANGNRAIARLLGDLGCHVDVVSGGELHRALASGFDGGRIIFGGVGKTRQELIEALDAQVMLLVVESEAELRMIDALAAERATVAAVALRVNPEITVETPHSYIRTGERGHKFGIPYDEVRDLALLAGRLANVSLQGLGMHVGSQLSRLDAYEHGIHRLLTLLDEIRTDGASELRYFDIGGGLAVTYDDEEPTDMARYAAIVVPAVRRTGLTLIVEPGRYLVANAGLVLTRVLYRKRSGGKELAVVDAGMTELLRPSHYNAYHRLQAVTPREARTRMDVVGPVCESGDFLALDRDLDDVQPGDLVAVHSAGAYGYVMASNYNARCRPAEVLVDGDRFAVVTRRENYDDLLRLQESSPRWRTA